MLAWGRFLYVDDLSTLPEARRRGYGMELLEWLRDEAAGSIASSSTSIRAWARPASTRIGSTSTPDWRSAPSTSPAPALAAAAEAPRPPARKPWRRPSARRQRALQLRSASARRPWPNESLRGLQPRIGLFRQCADGRILGCGCLEVSRNVRGSGFAPGSLDAGPVDERYELGVLPSATSATARSLSHAIAADAETHDLPTRTGAPRSKPSRALSISPSEGASRKRAQATRPEDPWPPPRARAPSASSCALDVVARQANATTHPAERCLDPEASARQPRG